VPLASDCARKQCNTTGVRVFIQPSAVGISNAMGERQNTFVCAFDPQSPRISAYEIHEWIYETLCLRESEVNMIQIDGPKRHVYIKVSDPERMQELLS
jgi:hypothetical protein